MPNPQDIFQLAQQTATQVTASPENWRRFLYTAAHNYHTTYLNQLLIHAQRPDATACATMKYWNKQAHRKVMYGSKSIIILQRHQGVPTAKRVFSMTDTVLTGDKAAAPWEVTDAIRPLLMNFGLPASKLVDTTAFEAKAPYNKYFVEALETAVPYPTNLNGSAFQTMFQKECESLWAGAITPEEFETRVDEQAAEILNK